VLDRLDAAAVRRWCSGALDTLEANGTRLDRLNVFPVADSDTGHNMIATLRHACEAVRAEDSTELGPVMAAMARGATTGAHGNSGVILSQILRGIADEFAGRSSADAESFALGLRRACDQAYAAVADPTEGTMLTVIAVAASAAAVSLSASAPGGWTTTTDPKQAAHAMAIADAGRLSTVVAAAADAAAGALERTPEQLSALAEAGVVDAGGLGLVLVLDHLAGTVTGTFPARSFGPGRGRHDHTELSETEQVLAPVDHAAGERSRETGSEEFGYEVQYLLDADAAAVTALRIVLGRLGDSLVVVAATARLWNVHVHVNDVGAAIEAGIVAGRPHRITVTRFADQQQARQGGSGVAIVAFVSDDGLAAVFADEGVHVVRIDPLAPPEVEVVVEAMRRLDAAQFVLLPNDRGLTALADRAAEQVRGTGREVAVVPTRSPAQALAAVAVHLESRRFGEDVIAMAEAAAATRSAQVVIAESKALTMAGWCEAGDALGLIEGEVAEIGNDCAAVACAVIDRLLRAGGELVTVLVGIDADAGISDVIEQHVAATAPHVEVSVLASGQADCLLLIGVE
jgi:dihydroxyacetone kinase-like predicted kinase